MHRKILMYHAVLQIVSSIRQKSVMQSILVSRAVMHVTAGIQNVQVSAVIHNNRFAWKTGDLYWKVFGFSYGRYKIRHRTYRKCSEILNLYFNQMGRIMQVGNKS